MLELLGKGKEVFEGLCKSAPELESFIRTRVVIGWLRNLPVGNVQVPDYIPLRSLTKNENGGYDGFCMELDYTFEGVSETYLTAILSVAKGEAVGEVKCKALDLAKLAKTIDMLIQSNHTPKQTEKKVDTVPTTASERPLPEIEPTPKKRQIKVNSIDLKKTCGICGDPLFKNEALTGCRCIKDTVSHMVTVTGAGGTFIKGVLEDDEFYTLLRLIKG